MRKGIFIWILFFSGLCTGVWAQNTNIEFLTKATFMSKVYNYEKYPTQWVYEGKKPCIIDFYADWCVPCKRFTPILEAAAKKYEGKIVVYKVNTDKEREMAQTFGISSIPTILFIPLSGEPRFVRGGISKEDLETIIHQVLLKE